MKKKTLVLVMIMLAMFCIASVVGRYQLSFFDITAILTGNNDSAIKESIFFNIRLPRNLFVVLAGAGLSLSGFVYQGIFRNPLASPDILGVSSGASVGAVMTILFANASAVMIQIGAFFAGIVVVVLAIGLAGLMKDSKLYSMIIAGIIMSAMANSAIMFLKYMADPTRQLATIDYWMMGSFHSITWSDVQIVLIPLMLSFVLLFMLRYKIHIMTLGDEEAVSLGVHVKLVRIIAIACATVIVSGVVSITGVISWIGLIVPHLVRMLLGENFRENFIQAPLLGGIILLGADVIARSISSSEIPISILTSFMGAITLSIFMAGRRK